jgi:NAD(P)-dependent dehydrogenase (short-subunit alcohol dehydrogenase family)
MNINLSGINILVTGSSRGIGSALAKAFAASGARVAVHYNSHPAEAEKLAMEIGEGAKAFGADLSKPENCRKLFTDVIASFEKLHVLVNNAGVAISSSLDKGDKEWLGDWQTTLNVNLVSAGLLTKLAIEHFVKNGGGRIINIASRAAFRGDTPEYIAYAASKGGMVAMSRSVARAFGKQNIKSFVIAPGFIRTEMAQDFIDEYGEEFVMKDAALSKLTEAEDVAPTAVLLASGLADHATGCTIDINAGSYVR